MALLVRIERHRISNRKKPRAAVNPRRNHQRNFSHRARSTPTWIFPNV